jgi:hypothetical protein
LGSTRNDEGPVGEDFHGDQEARDHEEYVNIEIATCDWNELGQIEQDGQDGNAAQHLDVLPHPSTLR